MARSVVFTGFVIAIVLSATNARVQIVFGRLTPRSAGQATT